MTSTSSKYTRLRGDTSATSLQLIYPTDLANSDSYSPHIVVFEPNIIKGSKQRIQGELSTPSVPIAGAYGNEVAINKSTRSVRSGRGFSDFGKGATNATYSKSGESMVLPMPPQFMQNYVTQWQTVEVGALARGLDMINSMKDHNFKTMADQAGESAKTALAGVIQTAGIANARDYLELTSGRTENSYAEVLFKGTVNRTIPFLYTFTPRSAAEAKLVQRLIHRFKFHQYPEYKYDMGNNSYMLHPSTFDISFMDMNTQAPIPWAGQMGTCALTNLSVNGTPNGEYNSMVDGAWPVCQLEMTFTELLAPTKEDFVNPDNSA